MSKITDIDNARIGMIIQLRRKERVLTLDQLGTAVGVAHCTLSRWETGHRPVPAARVEPLAAALGINPRIINPKAA